MDLAHLISHIISPHFTSSTHPLPSLPPTLPASRPFHFQFVILQRISAIVRPVRPRPLSVHWIWVLRGPLIAAWLYTVHALWLEISRQEVSSSTSIGIGNTTTISDHHPASVASILWPTRPTGQPRLSLSEQEYRALFQPFQPLLILFFRLSCVEYTGSLREDTCLALTSLSFYPVILAPIPPPIYSRNAHVLPTEHSGVHSAARSVPPAATLDHWAAGERGRSTSNAVALLPLAHGTGYVCLGTALLISALMMICDLTIFIRW